MPFVPDNSAADTANLIELVRMNRERKRSQFKSILDMALPGQTAEELGVTPQQYKEATGNELAPGTVLKPETATDKLDKGVRTLLDSWQKDPSIIDQATPGSIQAIYSGRLAQMLGLSGDTTGPGLTAQQKTSQTKAQAGAVAAQTTSDLITDGANAWKAADAKTRGQAGQQLVTGMTTSGLQSTEAQQVLDTTVRKQALKMVSDPNNPAWAPIKSLGINPIMAVSAAATGMLPLLDQYAQIRVSQAASRAESESSLSKAQSEWASKVSEATGGQLPPALIMKVMNDRMAGKLPTTPAEKGVDKLIDTATKTAFQAVLTDAFMKGNPQARMLPELIKAATAKVDAGQFNILTDAITTTTSEAIATQALGYPRPIVAGPERDAWDRAAALYKVMVPKDMTWYQRVNQWGHVDMPGAMQAPSTQPPSGGGAPASAAPSASGLGAGPSGASGNINLGPPAPAASSSPPARPAGPSANDLTADQVKALQQILPFLVPQQAAPAGTP